MIYVDSPTEYPPEMIKGAAKFCGRVWSHLWADDVEELHKFAASIGLKRSWFQNRKGFPHYDVTPSMRAKARKFGANSKSLADWLLEQKHLNLSGLSA